MQINSNGDITCDLVCSDKLKTGFTTQVEYTASACGIKDSGIETLIVTPLCQNITCLENYRCDYCTGDCVKIDLEQVEDVTGNFDTISECPTTSIVTSTTMKKEVPTDITSPGNETCYTNITPCPNLNNTIL